MNYSITTLGKKTIAGFHLVGPWDHTVKQGFEQLMMWVENHQVPAREWVAVYYDNPEEVPAEKLRCDSGHRGRGLCHSRQQRRGDPGGDCRRGLRLRPRAGGGLRLRHPVDAVFDSLQQSTAYRIAPQPCFEVYLNDGNHDGYWDIDMYVPVERVAS